MTQPSCPIPPSLQHSLLPYAPQPGGERSDMDMGAMLSTVILEMRSDLEPTRWVAEEKGTQVGTVQ
jgi:hypothetical protein